ncbi:MAG: hypothetical protein ACYTF9_14525 [Planctomycetota bacterium]|jgi:hypothetical protein
MISVRLLIVAAALVLTTGCRSDRALFERASESVSLRKITFDLDSIGEGGLCGPDDGRVAVSYEFCIPDDEFNAAEVRRIDPTLTISPGSHGRIGCGEMQALCIGSTHQPGFRDVLARLAALPYVEEIRECFFEEARPHSAAQSNVVADA